MGRRKRGGRKRKKSGKANTPTSGGQEEPSADPPGTGEPPVGGEEGGEGGAGDEGEEDETPVNSPPAAPPAAESESPTGHAPDEEWIMIEQPEEASASPPEVVEQSGAPVEPAAPAPESSSSPAAEHERSSRHVATPGDATGYDASDEGADVEGVPEASLSPPTSVPAGGDGDVQEDDEARDEGKDLRRTDDEAEGAEEEGGEMQSSPVEFAEGEEPLSSGRHILRQYTVDSGYFAETGSGAEESFGESGGERRRFSEEEPLAGSFPARSSPPPRRRRQASSASPQSRRRPARAPAEPSPPAPASAQPPVAGTALSATTQGAIRFRFAVGLEVCARLRRRGAITAQQSGALKDLILDEDARVLTILERLDVSGDVHAAAEAILALSRTLST